MRGTEDGVQQLGIERSLIQAQKPGFHRRQMFGRFLEERFAKTVEVYLHVDGTPFMATPGRWFVAASRDETASRSSPWLRPPCLPASWHPAIRWSASTPEFLWFSPGPGCF